MKITESQLDLLRSLKCERALVKSELEEKRKQFFEDFNE